MKVLISGSTGFVGQNLIKDLREAKIETEGFSLREVDWQHKLDRCADAIIHLAGKAHDTENTTSEEEYYKINRDLTISLFQEFLKSDIKDFFFFSSVKAVADTVQGILTEDTVPKPLTPYGKSKLEAEIFLKNRDLPLGKRLFIIRPCMIHGPGNKGNLNLLYKIVKLGLPWPLATFENQRSFLGIDNLSFLVKQMLTTERLESGIYNFADDECLSTNELVCLISNTLHKKPKLLKVSAGLINSAAKLGDYLSLPLTSEKLKKLTESYQVSNMKIKRSLNLDKLPFTVREGLVATIKSFNDKV